MAPRRPSHLVPGEVIEVVIEKGVYRGLGLARHEGQVVFVPRALPGERLSARIASVERGYVRGVVVERLAPSPFERPSPCGFFPRCGGCAYQHLDRGAELRLKEEVLRESLRRARVPWDAAVGVVPSPETAWRTRGTLHVEVTAGRVALGLYEEGSRRVVDLDGECLQLSPALNRTIGHLRGVLTERVGLAARIGDVQLAESADGRERVLWVDGDLTAAEAQSLGAATATAPWLTGMGVTLGPAGARRGVLIHGSPYVHADVGRPLSLSRHRVLSGEPLPRRGAGGGGNRAAAGRRAVARFVRRRRPLRSDRRTDGDGRRRDRIERAGGGRRGGERGDLACRPRADRSRERGERPRAAASADA
jgi:predicted RNA-binding protein with TRAM domain